MSIDWSGIPQVDPCVALAEVEAGKGTLVDVREPNEVADKSLKATSGVAFCPTTKLSQVTSAEALLALGVPSNIGTASNPAYMMCKAGVRGQKMAEVMKSTGCTHVANVTGGIMNCPAAHTK